MPGYKLVMVTDTMNQEDIFNAYYYLHSFFARNKFVFRYGKLFFLNYRVWKEWVLKAGYHGGYRRKIDMALKLLKPRLKEWSVYGRKK